MVRFVLYVAPVSTQHAASRHACALAGVSGAPNIEIVRVTKNSARGLLPRGLRGVPTLLVEGPHVAQLRAYSGRRCLQQLQSWSAACVIDVGGESDEVAGEPDVPQSHEGGPARRARASWHWAAWWSRLFRWKLGTTAKEPRV